MTTPSKTGKANSRLQSTKSVPTSKRTRTARRASLPFEVRRFAHLEKLWSPGDRILVAVSGGPDSVCLLHVLAAIAKKEKLELGVAHVDYRLRGNDSRRDALLAEETARTYELPFFLYQPLRKPKKNIEEELRHIRYRFFEKLAKQRNYQWIAVGHQEDDQAETFLLRLLRGSGRTGLSAMRPKEGRVIRPLLAASRHTLLRYLEAHRLPYRIDQSNTSPDFFRNRIRYELLPFLEAHFAPAIKRTLARTAQVLREEGACASQAVSPFPVMAQGDRITFSTHELAALPDAQALFFLRTLLTDLLSRPPSRALVGELLKTLRSQKSKSRKMAFQGLKLEQKGGTVTLRKTAC